MSQTQPVTPAKPLDPSKIIKPTETQKPTSQTKKRTEKFGKSKTTSTTHKPITQFNVDDDKSSPYAFDFESTEPSGPQVGIISIILQCDSNYSLPGLW